MIHGDNRLAAVERWLAAQQGHPEAALASPRNW